jgi:phage terminase Nu1 subunit (DNA packaging protein)
MMLRGWKEIANYMGYSVRTVQRWESLGIPVYRLRQDSPRSPVIADSARLDIWLQKQKPFSPDTVAEFIRRLSVAREESRESRLSLHAEAMKVRELSQKLRSTLNAVRLQMAINPASELTQPFD